MIFPERAGAQGSLLEVYPRNRREEGRRNYSAINYEVKCEFAVQEVRFSRARSRKVAPPSRILGKLRGPQTTIFLRKKEGAARFVRNPREITGSGDPTNSQKRPPRGVSNMTIPSWSHVFSRVQAPQGGYLTWWSRTGTTCFHVSRPHKRGVSNMVVPELEPCVFTCPGDPRGSLTWRPRVGTTCLYVSRPPRGVSNMVVPSWDHVCFTCPGHPGGEEYE